MYPDVISFISLPVCLAAKQYLKAQMNDLQKIINKFANYLFII